uniref:Uncharacterized protein n=1 Tax=Panagrolaimus davidi TaxID=227884 RepID=A0A914Q7C1_9BILA
MLKNLKFEYNLLGLPDPSDSVLWTDELMGNGNGYVKTGPFHDWDTNVLMPLSPVPVKKLYRFVLIDLFYPLLIDHLF